MKVVYFKLGSGREPVKDYINDLQKSERAIVLAGLNELEEHCLSNSSINLRPIKGKLWEIKRPIYI